MIRLTALATILLLLASPASGQTAKLVIHNGEHRQEIVIVPFSVLPDMTKPGMIVDVTTDVVFANGFEQRAPPEVSEVARKVTAKNGTEAPVKGIGERRATVD